MKTGSMDVATSVEATSVEATSLEATTDGLGQSAAVLSRAGYAALFTVAFALVYTVFFGDAVAHWNGIAADDDENWWSKLTTRFYFACTTTSTVGFGDISPKSMALRCVVALQMLLVAAGVLSVVLDARAPLPGS